MPIFEETPSEPMLFGGLNWSLVFNWDNIAVPIEVALGHIIVHVWHAVLISLFFMTELLPMLLGLGN